MCIRDSIYSAPLINLLSRTDRKHSVEAWHKVIDTNLSAVFKTSVCTIDQMISHKTKGVVINISSISAQGNAGQSAYSAAKAAINALTFTWAKELSMFGVRSAAIAPGFIETPSTHKALSDANIEKIRNTIPLKRLGSLEEIFKAVTFVIENDYYNGRVLEIDGGIVI